MKLYTRNRSSFSASSVKDVKSLAKFSVYEFDIESNGKIDRSKEKDSSKQRFKEMTLLET